MNTQLLSPYIRDAAEAIGLLPKRPRLMPIGRMYLIAVDHRDGAYFVETDALPRGKDMSPAEGLALLQQHDDAVAIWECNPSEGLMAEVSRDMAITWVDELVSDPSFMPADASTWPRFVQRHLTNDDVCDWVRG